MDPMGEEQLDYGDEDIAGTNRIYHQSASAGAAAIPAIADDEMGGDENEFDDLYDDVNVGEHFMQQQNSSIHQNPNPSNPNPNRPGISLGGNNGSLPSVTQPLNPKIEPPANASIPGIVALQQNPNVGNINNFNNSRVLEYTQENITHVGGDLGFQRGSNAQIPINVPALAPPVPRPAPVDPNGPTMLFVGELHWWTTDADLESVLTQYGRLKDIKFFDERASGKSKGYCQVEFYDAAAAATCKEGMDGYEFNGKACVVAFASPQTLRQIGASYVNRNQGQGQSQQLQQGGRRPMNDGMGRGGGGGDNGGRNFGRGNWGGGRGGQGMMGRGQGGGMRGRGFNGGRGTMGNNGPFGQGLSGPAMLGGPAGIMHAQNMMGPGFDPTFMGRGVPYGGFPGPAFAGMVPPFQAVNAVGLPGLAPHVNPAFFGRGMNANGMNANGMNNNGMDGQMWGDAGMGGGWTGEELVRTRESSYGGDDGASQYGYGEMNHERGGRSNASREKARGLDERRYRDDKEQDWDRSDKERHREEKDGYRDCRSRYRDYENEVDWDRGQSSNRYGSRSYLQEEDHRPRSRDADYERDYGKRRRK